MNLKKFSLILIGFYLLIFLVLPHTEYQPADPGIKIIQIQDFINSGYSTFAASYQGKYLDPDLKFFPTKPPWQQTLRDRDYFLRSVLLARWSLCTRSTKLNFRSFDLVSCL